jgi:RNA polymerase sigma-70 factor (ECF subfamily)
VGADKVARFLAGVRPPELVVDTEWTQVNGRPAVRLSLDGVLDSIVSVDVRDGLVREIFLVRNPAKLGHLDEAVGLTRG